jgi:TonB family protein
MDGIAFVNYLLKSSICLAFFYAFYLLLLKGQHCFKFNRFYFLVVLFLSLLLPLQKIFTFSIGNSTPIDPSIIIMPELIIVAHSNSQQTFNWLNLIYLAYGLGLFYVISRFIYRFWYVASYILVNRKRVKRENGYSIIHTNGELPTSSFFGYILWDNSQVLSSAERLQVLQHERIHVIEKHTLDIVLMEIVSALWWFNPVTWFLKGSVQENHEYMADSSACNNIKEYSSLLAKQTLLQQGIPITHSFKSSQVFKRLKMLKHYGKSTSYYRYVAIAFGFGVMLFSMSFSVEKTYVPDIETSLIHNVDGSEIYSNEIFTIVDEPAGPIEGMTAFYKNIAKNLSYPKQARTAGIEGKVYVEFIVNTNGKIAETNVLKGIGAGCDVQALKVVTNSPNWIPAKHNGKIVRQKIVLPISFKLQK